MTPDQPDGPDEGLVDQDYAFILRNITDYDESDLTITIDWGEGDVETIGPLPSGIEEIPVSHTWETAGVYTIRVKTNDSEKESEWSEPLDIHIAFLDIQLSGGMGVTMNLRNHLNETKPGRYIDWTMDLVGGTFPGFHINKQLSGTDYLEAGGSTIITQPVFALGKFNIEVTVQATGEPVITEEAEALVLFFYVIIQ
jgi:hypothetical protein